MPNVQKQFSGSDKISFFDFIPEESIIWFQDVTYTRERINSCFENAIALGANFKEKPEDDNEEEHELNSSPEELFCNAETVMRALDKFSTVEFGRQYFFKEDEWMLFDMEPQPSINKNFNLLIDHWRKYIANHCAILLFLIT